MTHFRQRQLCNITTIAVRNSCLNNSFIVDRVIYISRVSSLSLAEVTPQSLDPLSKESLSSDELYSISPIARVSLPSPDLVSEESFSSDELSTNLPCPL